MPLQNRVDPLSKLQSVSARGSFMGNRGRLHRADQTLITDKWRLKAWLICDLSFNQRHRTVMASNSYTELFFLDEVTALAAGHRPCFECRRARWKEFMNLWDFQSKKSTPMLDEVLHQERMVHWNEREYPTHRHMDLPTGTMVSLMNCNQDESEATPLLVYKKRLLKWSFDGYTDSLEIDPEEVVKLLTPPTTAQIIASGYSPIIHSSAEKF